MPKLCVFGDIHYIDKKPNWNVNRKLVEYADELTIKLVDKINNDGIPDGVYFEIEISKDNIVVNERHLKIDI